MTNRITDISQRQAAVVAGWGLLIMTLFYLSADFFVFQNLIVPGDATTTAKNIMAKEMLFRIGICSFLIVIVCDVVVATGFRSVPSHVAPLILSRYLPWTKTF